jgi:hypothetical protein
MPLLIPKIDCRCNLSITDLRNRLQADAVEAVECLRWWIKAGFLEDVKMPIEGDGEENWKERIAVMEVDLIDSV